MVLIRGRGRLPFRIAGVPPPLVLVGQRAPTRGDIPQRLAGSRVYTFCCKALALGGAFPEISGPIPWCHRTTSHRVETEARPLLAHRSNVLEPMVRFSVGHGRFNLLSPSP